MNPYLDLFLTFARIGVCTFGGGYAMLPLLQREIVENRGWATEDELMDYYAIGQCTPGIIAGNTATFIGYNRRGVLGAIIATLGVVFPSFVIISLISAVLSNFAHIAMVQHAFSGIRVAVCGLILQAVIKLLKSSVKNAMGWILLALTFLAVVLFDLSPVIVVVAAALTGILASRGRQKA